MVGRGRWVLWFGVFWRRRIAGLGVFWWRRIAGLGVFWWRRVAGLGVFWWRRIAGFGVFWWRRIAGLGVLWWWRVAGRWGVAWWRVTGRRRRVLGLLLFLFLGLRILGGNGRGVVLFCVWWRCGLLVDFLSPRVDQEAREEEEETDLERQDK